MQEILTCGFPEGNPVDEELRSIVNGLLDFLCGKPSEGFLTEEWYKPGKETQHFWW